MMRFYKILSIVLIIITSILFIGVIAGDTSVIPSFIILGILTLIVYKFKNTLIEKYKPSKSTQPEKSVDLKKVSFIPSVSKTDYYNRSGFGGIRSYQPILNCSEMPDRFVMLDLETTGLDAYSSRIIEIAMIRYVNGQKEDVYCQLIDPEIHIPFSATQVNGITDDMVRNQPKIYEIIDQVYDFINGEIIAGYNVEFDLKFLSVAFARSNKRIDNVIILDVLHVVKETIPQNKTKDRKLSTIKEYFGIKCDSHRALADCETTFQVLSRCLKIKENRALQEKADQLERLSKLNDNEKKFIAALEEQLTAINKKELLRYNIMSDRTINFKLQDMQIGRVKLNGRKYRMQILDKNNVLWLDIDSVEEAINNIKHWIKYCKYLAS